VHALYKTQDKKGDKAPTFTKQRAQISKPTKPLAPPPFYEPYWTDSKLINQQLSKGKLLAGRLFFDPELVPKNIGFVMPDPVVSEDGSSSL